MFQVAFGQIGIGREFWVMTPREFFNAWIGYNDDRKQQWEVLFYMAKYNAMRTAFSKEQAKAIQRDKPPWEKQTSNEPMPAPQVRAMLNLISKN